MRVVISSRLISAMIDHASQTPGEEICGLLLGDHGSVTEVVPAANIAADRACRFELDPAVLFGAIRAAREGGPQVIGHYHSHPTGSATPSATDAAMIGRAGELWVVIAGQTLTAWASTAGGGFMPLEIETGLALASPHGVGQSTTK